MEKLTPAEEEAMKVIWKIGEGIIKEFLAAENSNLPYTTFASTVKNLEKKKFLKSRLIGNVYLYTPAITESEYKNKFLNNVVRDHFGNSYKNLVNFFVEQKSITPKDLKEIVKIIEAGKKS